MKKLLLVFIFIPTLLSAQEKQYKFQTDLSYGFGIYKGWDNLKPGLRTTVNALTSIAQFNFAFTYSPRLTIGIEFRTRSFITGQDSNNVIINASSGAFLINTDYHFTDQKNKNAYVGFGFGGSNMQYSRMVRDSLGNTNVGEISARGPLINLRSGFRWYFSKHFGIQLNGNYSIYPMHTKSVVINGNEQDHLDYRNTQDVLFNFRGIELKFGLCLRF